VTCKQDTAKYSPKRLSDSAGLHAAAFPGDSTLLLKSPKTGSKEDGIRKYNNVTRRKENEKERRREKNRRRRRNKNEK
jgi:hypothetical protein